MSKFKILFPEALDTRVVEVAKFLNENGVCDAILEQLSLEEAAKKLASGYCDAVIAGACNSSRDVFRAAINYVGVKKEGGKVSSFFLMGKGDTKVAFADCAVNVNPSPQDLAQIAIDTADNFYKVTHITPKVAMLSYSTLGSAESVSIDNVRLATQIVKETRPDILISGELQFDSAFDQHVAHIKCPDDKVAGNANVFVFPDLNSGNISYKIAERMGGWSATGPIVQGMSKPFMDLSRGCSKEDIINLSKITLKLI